MTFVVNRFRKRSGIDNHEVHEG